jgi:hypothetical protein
MAEFKNYSIMFGVSRQFKYLKNAANEHPSTKRRNGSDSNFY